MAKTLTYLRDGALFHVDYTITGTDCSSEQTLDISNNGGPTWDLRRTVMIHDFSADIHAGTATSLTPILASVSGSTKARDTIQPTAGASVRPNLGEGVITMLAAGQTSLYLTLAPDTSHSTNDVRGRITFTVPTRGGL